MPRECRTDAWASQARPLAPLPVRLPFVQGAAQPRTADGQAVARLAARLQGICVLCVRRPPALSAGLAALAGRCAAAVQGRIAACVTARRQMQKPRRKGRGFRVQSANWLIMRCAGVAGVLPAAILPAPPAGPWHRHHHRRSTWRDRWRPPSSPPRSPPLGRWPGSG